MTRRGGFRRSVKGDDILGDIGGSGGDEQWSNSGPVRKRGLRGFAGDGRGQGGESFPAFGPSRRVSDDSRTKTGTVPVTVQLGERNRAISLTETIYYLKKKLVLKKAVDVEELQGQSKLRGVVGDVVTSGGSHQF